MSTTRFSHHGTLRGEWLSRVPQEQLGAREHTALHSAPLLSGQPDLSWGQRGDGKCWWGAAEALHSSSASALAEHRSSLGCVRRSAASSLRSSFLTPLLSSGEATVSSVDSPVIQNWTQGRADKLLGGWEHHLSYEESAGMASCQKDSSMGSYHCQYFVAHPEIGGRAVASISF